MRAETDQNAYLHHQNRGCEGVYETPGKRKTAPRAVRGMRIQPPSKTKAHRDHGKGLRGVHRIPYQKTRKCSRNADRPGRGRAHRILREVLLPGHTERRALRRQCPWAQLYPQKQTHRISHHRHHRPQIPVA